MFADIFVCGAKNTPNALPISQIMLIFVSTQSVPGTGFRLVCAATLAPDKLKSILPMGKFRMFLLTVATVTMAGAAACAGSPEAGRDGGAATVEQSAMPVDDIYAFARQRYGGCQILDRDYDNGYTEIKIRHGGQEKIMLTEGGKAWVRTLWEIRRERLPQKVIDGMKREGLAYEAIDDNDNQVVDTPDGLYYAVQARRNDEDHIYIVTPSGKIVSRISSDAWDDGRVPNLYSGGSATTQLPGRGLGGRNDEVEHKDSHRYGSDGGEDRFGEGDDEWDSASPRRKAVRQRDDGEDRFDEGDDEWDSASPRRKAVRQRDNGEDRFDEGDDEWPSGKEA